MRLSPGRKYSIFRGCTSKLYKQISSTDPVISVTDADKWKTSYLCQFVNLWERDSGSRGKGINMHKAEKPRERKMIYVYLKEVKNLIRCDNLEGALKTLDKALTEHPFNALLLSYYGYLDAIVNKNYERGTDLCKTAIETYKEESREEGSWRHNGFHPVLYLHLGRTYLAGGNKNFAVKSFKQGLEVYPEDPYLLSEVRRMGIRRKPIIPFLKRSNPINRYVGMLIHNK